MKVGQNDLRHKYYLDRLTNTTMTDIIAQLNSSHRHAEPRNQLDGRSRARRGGGTTLSVPLYRRFRQGSTIIPACGVDPAGLGAPHATPAVRVRRHRVAYRALDALEHSFQHYETLQNGGYQRFCASSAWTTRKSDVLDGLSVSRQTRPDRTSLAHGELELVA